MRANCLIQQENEKPYNFKWIRTGGGVPPRPLLERPWH